MSILDHISVAERHTGFKTMCDNYVDMLTDGQFAIRRELLVGRKLKPFMLQALNLPINEAVKTRLNDLIGETTISVAIEMHGAIASIDEHRALCRFDEVDGNLRTYACANLVKLIQESLPDGDWYASAPLKPLMYCTSKFFVERGPEHVMAILMPVQTTRIVPGFIDQADIDRIKGTTKHVYKGA